MSVDVNSVKWCVKRSCTLYNFRIEVSNSHCLSCRERLMTGWSVFEDFMDGSMYR